MVSKIRKVTVLLLLIAITPSFSQQSKVDSLEQVLGTALNNEHASIYNQLSEITRKEPQRSLEYAKKALALSERRDIKQHIIALKNIGIALGYDNKYDEALQTLLSSLKLAENSHEWTLAGEDAINIGTVYYVILSNHEKGIEYYLKALSYYEKTNYQKGIAAAYSGLGIAYTDEKKFREAQETLFKSLAIYEKLGEKKEVPKIHVNIGSSFKKMGDLNKAIDYLLLAVQGFNETNNKRGKAHALYVIGDIYRIQKNYSKAISTLEEALALNEESNHRSSIVECLIQLGETYLDMNDLVTAEKNLQRAIPLATGMKKYESLSAAYQHLSTIYKKQNKPNEAFEFLTKHKIIYDSIYQASRSKQIAEMQARFDSQNKEKEIMLLRQEKALNQTYLIIAVLAIIFLAVVSALIINRQKMKIRNERELAEKESQLMEERKTLFEAELRNRELAEQQLHDQIEYKNKELASYTLNLIQKNEILENLKEAVDEIKSAPETQIKQKLTGLVNMVNYSFHLDRDWENFKIHFEQVHQDFFKKLIERHPDLSANDLKLCSLIKLNLDNKGIAAILNISQESAKVARHRLRKKLELGAEQTLIAFLNSVENETEVAQQ
jgi:tetratricopeptide (TPR) repeat protein